MVAAQQAEIAELRERIARLERMISRDSGNSSMPPSSDDALPGRKPSRQQRRSAGRTARKWGKQPGAPGSAMCWAEPDQVVGHYPQGACGCGADLREAEDLGVARPLQQLEFPAPSALRVQHELHRSRSGCGREHVAARPPGALDAAVWPTNNISEHGVRPLKTQQKISGRLTSEDTTQDRLDIRSYIDTARKHGHDALTILRSLMTGNPWTPPAPASDGECPESITQREADVTPECLHHRVSREGLQI